MLASLIALMQQDNSCKFINVNNEEHKNFLSSFENIENMKRYLKIIEKERDQLSYTIRNEYKHHISNTKEFKERFTRLNNEIDLINICLYTDQCKSCL